jgi:hypothetical protein
VFFIQTGESSQTFTKTSQHRQVPISILVQNSHLRHRKSGAEKEMNNNFATHTIEGDSDIKNAAIGVFVKTRNLIQCLFCTIKQGIAEIDTISQDHQNKQQQVYRYSIGRMTKFENLQMGLYRDQLK